MTDELPWITFYSSKTGIPIWYMNFKISDLYRLYICVFSIVLIFFIGVALIPDWRRILMVGILQLIHPGIFPHRDIGSKGSSAYHMSRHGRRHQQEKYDCQGFDGYLRVWKFHSRT